VSICVYPSAMSHLRFLVVDLSFLSSAGPGVLALFWGGGFFFQLPFSWGRMFISSFFLGDSAWSPPCLWTLIAPFPKNIPFFHFEPKSRLIRLVSLPPSTPFFPKSAEFRDLFGRPSAILMTLDQARELGRHSAEAHPFSPHSYGAFAPDRSFLERLAPP